MRLRFRRALAGLATAFLPASLALAAGIAPASAQMAFNQPNFVNEVKLGVLAHDVPYLWSGFNLESGVDFSGEVIFSPHVNLLGGTIRPGLGATINSSGYTSRAYLTTHWEWASAPTGLFFSVGLGAAIHDGHLEADAPDRKALGARVLFHIPVELGYRFDEHNSLSFYFEHMSNANTNEYNEGMDNLGIRYGYRF